MFRYLMIVLLAVLAPPILAEDRLRLKLDTTEAEAVIEILHDPSPGWLGAFACQKAVPSPKAA